MMLSVKKCVCLLLAVAMLCVLFGCEKADILKVPDDAERIARNDGYDIWRSGSSYYLEGRGESASTSSGQGLQATDWPVFSSLKTMKDAILSGNVPESRSINRAIQRNDGVLRMCNLDSLYEPALPSRMHYDRVSWQLDKYTFHIKGAGWDGYLFFETADDFQSRLSGHAGRHESILRINERYYVERLHAIDPDKNAEVVYYTITTGTFSRVLYSFELDGKTLYIDEAWNGACPYAYENSQHASDPGSLVMINFFGQQDGIYFSGYITGRDEMPSDEWVQSFGLKPYVETETE